MEVYILERLKLRVSEPGDINMDEGRGAVLKMSICMPDDQTRFLPWLPEHGLAFTLCTVSFGEYEQPRGKTLKAP